VTPRAAGTPEILAAVPRGSRRTRSQRRWIRHVSDLIEAQSWYACRKVHYAGITRRLMLHASWKDATTRPGHGNIAAAVGVSTDTVARCVAWLRREGLLGLVSPGISAAARASVLRPDAGNEAAVYVLCLPARKSPLPRVGDHQESADPTQPRSGQYNTPARPRELTRGILRKITDGWMHWITRPFLAEGWNTRDLAHAVDYDPSGRQWRFSHDVRNPAAWARWRLAHWIQAGTVLPSRSQRLAANAVRHRAEHAWAREQRATIAAAASADPAGHAARIRASLANSGRAAWPRPRPGPSREPR